MAQSDPAHLAVFGTGEPSERTRLLQAGALSAEFIGGELRNIRYHGHEVLRAIAYLVRDRDWGTYAPQIRALEIDEGEDRFGIRYEAVCLDAAGAQQLRYRVRIEAGASELQVEAQFQADTRFLTCRNGFVVLHPIDTLAGQPATIGHPGGVIEESRFPEVIAPWQPFKDIASIGWAVTGGIAASCLFEGDVFEMEDQRNWSDASYKTYVRPLERPWPYWIEQGDTENQAVRLKLVGRPLAPPAGVDDIVLTLEPDTGRHPAIGISLGRDETPAVLRDLDSLRALGPQVLLCRFDQTGGDGAAVLSGYAAVAARYPARYVLECTVPGAADPASELAGIAAQVRASGLALAGIAVSPAVDRISVPPGSPWPPCPALDEVYAAARDAFPGIPLGGGMFSYFTELNRKRPPFGQLDWVTHATNPIVHAAGDTAVMQTLAAIPHITRSCRAMIGPEKAYWIGPVTIGMRQNPYGSKTMDNPHELRMPMAGSDPRERALFGAAWLLGYAAQAVDAALDVLTLGPLCGPRGLSGTSHPYPMYHVVQALAQLAGQTRLRCRSSQPATLLALGALDPHGAGTLWVANLSPLPQTFRIRDGLPACARTRRVLDADGLRFEDEPVPPGGIALAPYACMEVCWPGSAMPAQADAG